MDRPYHRTLWSYWQLLDCRRLDRVLAEHDRLNEAYLTHYAVNNPEALKQRDLEFREEHTYQKPISEVLTVAEAMIAGVRDLMAYNERVARRQRRQQTEAQR